MKSSYILFCLNYDHGGGLDHNWMEYDGHWKWKMLFQQNYFMEGQKASLQFIVRRVKFRIKIFFRYMTISVFYVNYHKFYVICKHFSSHFFAWLTRVDQNKIEFENQRNGTLTEES